MKEFHVIDSIEQMRVLADPLRLRLLETFAERPATTKQVAVLLGEKPTKLYHHVDALERIGFLKLVETRQNRGTIEKYYEPIARQFTVKHDLLSNTGANGETRTNLISIITYALEETASEIRQSAEAGLLDKEKLDESLAFSRFQISGTKEEIAATMKKLRKVVSEAKQMQANEGEIKYGVTVAFYPVKKK